MFYCNSNCEFPSPHLVMLFSDSWIFSWHSQILPQGSLTAIKTPPSGLVDFGSGQFQTAFLVDQKINLINSFSHEHTKENNSSSFLIKLGRYFKKLFLFSSFSSQSVGQFGGLWEECWMWSRGPKESRGNFS